MQSSISGACLKPRQIGRVAAGRASGIQLGDDGGGGIDGADGVASSRIVGILASSSPHILKSRMMTDLTS